MKARIVDIDEIRKTPEEREAEELLNELGPGKAIEITLADNDTPKKLARLFRQAAKRLHKYVRIETMDHGARLLVYIKSDDDRGDDD